MFTIHASLFGWIVLAALLILLSLACIALWNLQLHSVVRKRTEQLRQSEQNLKAFLDQAGDGIMIASNENRYTYANPRMAEILGYETSDIVGKEIGSFSPPNYSQLRSDHLSKIREGKIVTYQNLLLHKKGHRVPIEITASKMADGRIIGIFRDITQRVQTEEELKESQARLHAAIESLPFEFWAVNTQCKYILQNSKSLKNWGDVLGRHPLECNLPHDLTMQWIEDNSRALRGEIVRSEAEVNLRGEKRYAYKILAPIWSHGQIKGALGVSIDVSDRKKAESALMESEARLHQITDAIPGVVYQYRQNQNAEIELLFINARSVNVLELTPAELLQDINLAWKLVIPEDVQGLIEAVSKASAQNASWTHEFRIKTPSGTLKWIRGSAVPKSTPSPESTIWNGILLDVTQSKQYEELFLQAQKMESIGRLAGGVAHDFNNVLSIISGNAEALQEKVDITDQNQKYLDRIKYASDRGSELTRQLLTFSRKHALKLEVLDLNKLVLDAIDMVKRLMGEDIDLDFRPLENKALIHADPSQILQIVLNLVINARDAMPGGGKLTIQIVEKPLKTEFVSGTHIGLIVSDTGIGMDRATQDHLFEPFFTTKEIGKGTGLGLSTVYGIVKQCHGQIYVESEVGAGSTFNIYIPRAFETKVIESKTWKQLPRNHHAQNNRIILVEDEAALRALTRESLESRGYQVLEASNGKEALELCQSFSSSIELAIVDVIMPKMNGPEFYDHLQKIHPETRVLYTSGYLDNLLPRLEENEKTWAFLEKPYVPTQLVNKVQQLLENQLS